MAKQNHKAGFLVAAMVFCAIALRVLGKFDILIVPGGSSALLFISLFISDGEFPSVNGSFRHRCATIWFPFQA